MLCFCGWSCLGSGGLDVLSKYRDHCPVKPFRSLTFLSTLILSRVMTKLTYGSVLVGCLLDWLYILMSSKSYFSYSEGDIHHSEGQTDKSRSSAFEKAKLQNTTV